VVLKFYLRETMAQSKNERRIRRPAFLFAPQFRKSRDNQPHPGRQNHCGQRRLPQIQLLFFESSPFQLVFVCGAMKVRVMATRASITL